MFPHSAQVQIAAAFSITLSYVCNNLDLLCSLVFLLSTKATYWCFCRAEGIADWRVVPEALSLRPPQSCMEESSHTHSCGADRECDVVFSQLLPTVTLLWMGLTSFKSKTLLIVGIDLCSTYVSPLFNQGRGERAYDIYSRLLRERIICVMGPVSF